MMLNNPYRQLFRTSGSARFFIAALVARFPHSMMTLGIVIMLSSTREKYGLPSLVASVCVLSCALIAPQLSRLADAYGQRRIAIPAIALAMVAYTVLVLTSLLSWPDWVLFVSAIGIGFMPNFGAFSRARWSALHTGTPLLHSAFAMESLCEEIIWMSGPVIVTACATRMFPEAGMIAAALLFVVGAGYFCAQTRTEPAPGVHGMQWGGKPAILNPAVLLPALALFAFGGFFGVLEVATTAFAKQVGMAEKTFYPLSSYAIGSLVTGVAYGMVRWKMPLRRQLLWVAGAFLLTTIPFFFIADLWRLTLLALITGATCSPFIIISLALVEQLVSKDNLTESMTWALVSPAIGMAAGFALTGDLVDRFNPVQAFYATTLFSAMAFLLVMLAQNRLRSCAQEASGCDDAACPQTLSL